MYEQAAKIEGKCKWKNKFNNKEINSQKKTENLLLFSFCCFKSADGFIYYTLYQAS